MLPVALQGGIHAKAWRSKTKRFRGVFAGMKVVSNVKLDLIEYFFFFFF
jgi:hypothetical protein